MFTKVHVCVCGCVFGGFQHSRGHRDTHERLGRACVETGRCSRKCMFVCVWVRVWWLSAFKRMLFPHASTVTPPYIHAPAQWRQTDIDVSAGLVCSVWRLSAYKRTRLQTESKERENPDTTVFPKSMDTSHWLARTSNFVFLHFIIRARRDRPAGQALFRTHLHETKM